MKNVTTTFVTVAVIIATMGCAPNMVEVCDANSCSTGFYGNDGEIITAAHRFDVTDTNKQLAVKTGYVPVTAYVDHMVGYDVVALKASYEYAGDVEYCARDSVKVGDSVRVHSFGRFRRAKVVKQNGFVFYIDTVLRVGDSGSVVIHRESGCVFGIARAVTSKTTQIVALYPFVEVGELK
jgi:hypothetical protein